MGNHPRMMADVNGDGKSDIVAFGTSCTYTALANSLGTFGNSIVAVNSFGYGSNAGGWKLSEHIRTMADVNGDGKMDIIGFGDNGVSVSTAKSIGNGTFNAPIEEIDVFGYNNSSGSWRVGTHPRFISDINGDGKADIIGIANDGVYTAKAD